MSPSRKGTGIYSWDWGIALILSWGVFSPTALNGEISSVPVAVSTVLLVGLHAWTVWRYGVTGRFTTLASLLIIGLPLLFTFNVEGARVAWGKALFFIMLSATFIPNYTRIGVTRWTRVYFNIVSIALLVVAALILLAPEYVEQPLILYYNDYYNLLMPNMLANGKPVGTFTSHNVAALFYFFFFYLHLRTFSVYPRLYNLVMALGFLVTILFLKSNTALAFTGIGLAELFYLLNRTRGHLSKIYAIGIALSAIACLLLFRARVFETVEMILNSDANGLAGRFSQSGNLLLNIDYLRNHPFRPVGFQLVNDLFFGDCGYIETALRGSLPLVACTYFAFVSFVKNNVLAKTDRWTLLGAILVMEIGFSILISLRFLFLFPFVVIYLNGLERAGRLKAEKIKAVKA